MKFILCLLLPFNFFITLSAQKINFNLFIGTANYYGDLQSKRYTFNQAKLAGGIGISYEVSDKFFIRGLFSGAKVSADDKLNPELLRVRNLNFTTTITEAQLAGEYYFFSKNDNPIAPYIFAGIALYHFNPYTKDTFQNKFFLQPLSTEGQGFYQDRKPYNLAQFAIPFGGGFKIAISENISIGLEIGFRKLFTDYLDDVSKPYIDPAILLANRGAKAVELAYRGNELKNGLPSAPVGGLRGGEKYKDWYYFTLFTTSFKIGGGHGNRSRSKLGCPAGVY